jgi:single-stranded DNA-specific DHH superfamily exonuclease
MEIKNLEETSKRILEAIEKKERILICMGFYLAGLVYN